VNRAARRYAAVGGALAAAGLAAACGSSGTSSSAASPSASVRTGTQTLAGSVAGRAALSSATAIPLRLTGLVNTSATISLRGQANPVMIKTGQGTLAVTHTTGTTSQKLLSTKTCKFAFGQRSQYTVDSGKSSGTFKGATGTGTAVITLTGNLPKNTAGKCDTSSTAVPQSGTARVSFVARGPLTVKK
jgi:hypothetical protein